MNAANHEGADSANYVETLSETFRMKWEWSRRYSSSRGSLTSFTLEEASLSQPSLSRRTASHRLARKLEKWEESVEWKDRNRLSGPTLAFIYSYYKYLSLWK